jgi:hypothetical protein
MAALARAGWAVRRLTGGPGPEVDLSAFLDRRDPENLVDEAEPFADRAGGWLNLMAQAAGLYPITRSCMGFHLWSLAGLGQHGDRIEAAVTAARIAASEDKGAAPCFRGHYRLVELELIDRERRMSCAASGHHPRRPSREHPHMRAGRQSFRDTYRRIHAPSWARK